MNSSDTERGPYLDRWRPKYSKSFCDVAKWLGAKKYIEHDEMIPWLLTIGKLVLAMSA